jgi:hypothetical protein
MKIAGRPDPQRPPGRSISRAEPHRIPSLVPGRNCRGCCAAVIAEALRECGYPDCTAEVVTAELAKQERERSSIGRFAADALEQYGWRP